jgi:CRISPR/Cas system CSM-associated protein Csm3 (group 7 of RAMP superfamily)
MTTVNYTIEFFSDWHCGSGLAAGADVDALVIKDKDRFPYIPGKTIKGLVREAIEILYHDSGDQIVNAFGASTDAKGVMFFENAVFEHNLKETIKKQETVSYLYRNLASTAIDENGIAKEHSLRRIEVVVPCKLVGTIHDVPDEIVPQLKKSLAYIKRLGVNRNRGLGRCKFTVEKEENV